MKKMIFLLDRVTPDGEETSHAKIMCLVTRALIPGMSSNQFKVLGLPNTAFIKTSDFIRVIDNALTYHDLNNSIYLIPHGFFKVTGKFLTALRKVWGDAIPKNGQKIKEGKEAIKECFALIGTNPEKYNSVLKEIDEHNQELHLIGTLFRGISDLVRGGAKVNIIAGNARDWDIRDICKERGISLALQAYLHDRQGGKKTMEELFKSLREPDPDQWDDINLLSFSDGLTIGATDSIGNPHIFSNNNPLVSCWYRGCFDVSPVKDIQGRVLGYSIIDTKTVQWLSREFWVEDGSFWGIKQRDDLEWYLGRLVYDTLATPRDHQKLARKIRSKEIINLGDLEDLVLEDTDLRMKQVFRISDILTIETRERLNIDLMGEWIDASLSYVFTTNNNCQLIIKKFSVDRSGRPSVFPLNGTCFALIDALTTQVTGGAYAKTIDS